MTRYVFSTADTIHYRFPTHVNDLVMDRAESETAEVITCTGMQPVRYLSVDAFVEGKSATEPTWDSHARAMCEEYGWDYHQVRTRP